MPPSHKKIKLDDATVSITGENPSTSKENNGDWREIAISFKERHKHALKEGILTDITFTVGPHGQQFSAHKMILALASPVFEAMFYGSLKETSEIIGIPDLMPGGFQSLLDYIYTDEMEFKNETDTIYAWFAAEKYCLTPMRDLCCNYLSSCELTHNKVWIILENSIFLNSSSLTEKCLLYLKKNIDEAIDTPGFLEIGDEIVKKILSMDSLYIKEVRLLDGIVRWAKEKMKNGAEESLEQFLAPFLRHVRFGSMSQEDFVDFIDIHKNVVSDSDALAILKYMTDKRTYPLPDWCSHNVYPRRACEKRQVAIRKVTSNIRSYAVKPQSAPMPDEIGTYHHSDNSLYYGLRHGRANQSPPPSIYVENSSGNYDSEASLLLTSDTESDDDFSRRAPAANGDSEDSTSSSSTTESLSSV